jgi:hypothetical protein
MVDTYVGGHSAHDAARSEQVDSARSARRKLYGLLTALALAGLCSLAPATTARAGTFLAYLCQGPAFSAVGTAGLHEELVRAAPYVSGEAACASAGQEITMQLGPDAEGYANLQGGDYIYQTPAGVTISAYMLRISAYAAPCAVASGQCPGGVGTVFVNHSGQLDPHYDFRDLGAGAQGPTTVTASELRDVDSVMIGATCDSGCPSAQEIAAFAVPYARFTLVDSTIPKVSTVSGPREGQGPIAGQAQWSYSASDVDGSGLYGAVVAVDGKTVAERVISENGGLCKDLGSNAEPIFVSPQPCPVEVSAATSLDTNDLADGEHSVHVYVDTAGGNTADVFDGKLTTANGPVVLEAPTIAGTAQVGSTLDAANGIFSLRTEQEWAGAVGGQWERCVAPSSCQSIGGATSPTYVPTTADVGHQLVYESIATAKVTDPVAPGLLHTTRALSVPTLAVGEAGVSGSSCIGGCLNPANGGPAPSSGSGTLGSAARWQISLKVSPRNVHRHTKILLTGRVATSPRPSAGKLVYLQARSVGARWITFMALRAKPGGAFSTTYRFRLGGRHTYQFRAVAPAEGQFRNATGNSAIVAVHET